jgi:hypothetical protein
MSIAVPDQAAIVWAPLSDEQHDERGYMIALTKAPG